MTHAIEFTPDPKIPSIDLRTMQCADHLQLLAGIRDFVGHGIQGLNGVGWLLIMHMVLHLIIYILYIIL